LLRIRLSRVGKKKQPAYRLVVADSHAPRDGAFVEIIGQYNPRTDPMTLVVKEDAAVEWLRRGAQPSETAAKLLTRIGVMERAGRAPVTWDRTTPVMPKKAAEEAAPAPAVAAPAPAAAAPAPAAAEAAAEAPKAEAAAEAPEAKAAAKAPEAEAAAEVPEAEAAAEAPEAEAAAEAPEVEAAAEAPEAEAAAEAPEAEAAAEAPEAEAAAEAPEADTGPTEDNPTTE
jgi:small subunit ribosomal protein S16